MTRTTTHRLVNPLRTVALLAALLAGSAASQAQELVVSAAASLTK